MRSEDCCSFQLLTANSVRKIDSPCKFEFLTTERDPWLKKGKLVLNLSNLRRMINRMLAQSELDCSTIGGGSRSSES